MTKVCNFTAGLARVGKSLAEIKITVDAAVVDKAMKVSIYFIMKKVSKPTKTVKILCY
jgi:hypothetical protein